MGVFLSGVPEWVSDTRYRGIILFILATINDKIWDSGLTRVLKTPIRT